MKIISKRKGTDLEPSFTLTKQPEPNKRNAFILRQYNELMEVELTQTKKGYEVEMFVCTKFIKFFLSNAEIEIIE